MTAWILAALGLFVLQTFLPPLFRYVLRADPEIMATLGPRDDPPEATKFSGRSERALRNMIEAMVVFVPLALLGVGNAEAAFGAQIFVLARVAYIPAYVLGIPVIRSLIWIAGAVGLYLMAAAIW